MSQDIQQLGKTIKLSNGSLQRIDVDDGHYYFHNGQFHISLTHVLDVGAPFPVALRDYLRNTDPQQSAEVLEQTGARGSKLHDALDRLAQGVTLKSEEYRTSYEKEAIATFIRYMRFLQPERFVTEIMVSDTNLRVSGTLDFKGYVDRRKMDMLLDPNTFLEFEYNSDGDYWYAVKEKYQHLLEGKPEFIKVIIDWKFTGRNTYNHKIQVAAYAEMDAMSYADEQPVTRKFTWRFSPKHKFHFDMSESEYSYESFRRIYDTTMEYLALSAGKYWKGFPEPPEIVVYPDKFKLFDVVTAVKELVHEN